MLDVWVELAVLNLLNLVVSVVDMLEVCWWVEVEQSLNLVVACVQLDEVLNS